MKKQLLSGLIAAALLGLAAPPVSAQNIAIVNGKPVPKERADMLRQQLERSGRPVTPEIEKQINAEVIDREVLVQAALERGLEGSADYKNQMELAREAILINALFADFRKANPVTDAEAQAEYDKFVAANNGKEYKASHILVDKEADAKAIIATIKKGAKFEDIAKKQSKDPGSGAKGGDLGWASPASYVSEFTEALIKLDKGKMTDAPVKSQFGWHVIRLDDMRPVQLPKLEEVKPQVAQQLLQQKQAKYQEDLRAKAKIE
ncbi:peptidylprolyl isomerase [Verminephrobacter eiseniae]|uniref:peptidylprolyl isomerase n=1 Tax=Verminephrobacter eiseniae TaxID=364317 RepID=UPI00223901B0|nr:peptidylprolyl isomerase [Verminephrobacter eiseniae]MCW5236549.1 peptidylprolyl isomerase [Verminephrobacter eiseniae]